MNKKRPFDLPAAPVDGYEVRLWHVGRDSSDRYYVHQWRAKYHVNTPWSAVSNRPGGQDLVNHWQIFDNDDRFCGRSSDGWAVAWSGATWEDYFPSRSEAFTEAVRCATELAARLRERVARAERNAVELAAALP